ncbi:hypothetical protein LINPERPRIM_LOCUS4517 [Linum perenne]
MNIETMNSEMPSKLNAGSSSVVVSPDKLSVKATTVQSVQSNKPIPVNFVLLYYFEMQVNFGHKPFAYDTELRYPGFYCTKVDNNGIIDDDSQSSSMKEESWKSLMKKSESMLRKSIEEKEEEVASLKEAMKALTENFGKYL